MDISGGKKKGFSPVTSSPSQVPFLLIAEVDSRTGKISIKIKSYCLIFLIPSIIILI